MAMQLQQSGMDVEHIILRVVKRGKASEWLAAAPHHMFVSHGKLALLAQSFLTYFDQLPICVRSDGTNATDLLHTSAKSPGVAYRVLNCELDYNHALCFFLVAGLTARSYLYAHSRKSNRSRLFC
jgi:diadenosine tetraphosphatase ApaH/serine/threonine PP2A family protein phosphatase